MKTVIYLDELLLTNFLAAAALLLGAGLLCARQCSGLRLMAGSAAAAAASLGILLSLFLPGLYIALTQFHTHLLPMNLLTSIAEARSNVPFPVIGEILVMEFSFFLINEAGTRIPSQICLLYTSPSPRDA